MFRWSDKNPRIWRRRLLIALSTQIWCFRISTTNIIANLTHRFWVVSNFRIASFFAMINMTIPDKAVISMRRSKHRLAAISPALTFTLCARRSYEALSKRWNFQYCLIFKGKEWDDWKKNSRASIDICWALDFFLRTLFSITNCCWARWIYFSRTQDGWRWFGTKQK